MADTMTPRQRSATMRAIKGADTGPERAVLALLRGLGFRPSRHAADLPGRPDLVFRRRRKAVFVHGCFWHRHGCAATTTPATRRAFWLDKFARNVARDRRVQRALRAAGWSVCVVWQCRLRRPDLLARRLDRFLRG